MKSDCSFNLVRLLRLFSFSLFPNDVLAEPNSSLPPRSATVPQTWPWSWAWPAGSSGSGSPCRQCSSQTCPPGLETYSSYVVHTSSARSYFLTLFSVSKFKVTKEKKNTASNRLLFGLFIRSIRSSVNC